MEIAEVKKINVEFDFDNKNNELHFNVFDNEEYVIGIFSDGFFYKQSWPLHIIFKQYEKCFGFY